MAMPDQAGARTLGYRLRSMFYLAKLREYKSLDLLAHIASLASVEHLYAWDAYEQWNIGQDAFVYINNHPELLLLQVFCHPRILREQPYLCAYYRNVAALSQKAVQQLIHVHIGKFERETAGAQSIDEETALALARLFNEHISLIVDSALQSLTQQEVFALLFASIGAQIDGSWRNAIGAEAEKAVQRMLVKEAIMRNKLAAFLLRVKPGVDVFDPSDADATRTIERYRGIVLANQTSIVFASDPDIALLDQNGRSICIIEVKGGTDPAGALERFGAALKSFEAARSATPSVVTMLVSYMITDEMRKRIEDDRRIEAYDLNALLDEQRENVRDAFLSRIFDLLQ
jgi:hypothetical protein